MRQALRHHNDVVLISNSTTVLIPAPLAGRVELGDLAQLVAASPNFAAFHRLYQPWGLREPWEEENMLRFFVLSAYMQRESLAFVFFADTDVALNAPIPEPPLPGCDSMVMQRLSHTRDQPFSNPGKWGAWAGTSILSAGMLADFLDFAMLMYTEPYIAIVREKRDKSPFVCDMTHWYFYIGAADQIYREKWGITALLPPTAPRRICDAADFGYNSLFSDLSNGLQGPPPIRSIHFQGGWKELMATYAEFSPGEYD